MMVQPAANAGATFHATAKVQATRQTSDRSNTSHELSRRKDSHEPARYTTMMLRTHEHRVVPGDDSGYNSTSLIAQMAFEVGIVCFPEIHRPILPLI